MSQAEARRVDRLCSVAVCNSLEEDRTTLGNCKFFYQEMLHKQAQKPWHTLSEASLIPSEGHLKILKNLDVKGPVVFDSPSRILGSKIKAPTSLFHHRQETACLTDDVPWLWVVPSYLNIYLYPRGWEATIHSGRTNWAPTGWIWIWI